jgi:hypothetical protein
MTSLRPCENGKDNNFDLKFWLYILNLSWNFDSNEMLSCWDI